MRKISNKIIFSSLLSVLITALIISIPTIIRISGYSEESIRILEASMREDYDSNIKEEVEIVSAMLDAVYQWGEDQGYSPKEREAMGIAILQRLKFGESGYFWADTLDGTNVAMLGQDSEGKSRIDLQDTNGTYIIQEFIKVSQNGGGYTDYWFPKVGETEPLPKRSYTELAPKFEWVIGTGNYIDDIDDIDAIISEKQEAEEAIMKKLISTVFILILCGMLLSTLFSYFVGKRISKPIKNTSDALENIASEDADLTKILENHTNDEIYTLVNSFNAFTGKLRSIISNIKSSVFEASGQRTILDSSAEKTKEAVGKIDKEVTSLKNKTDDLQERMSDSDKALGEIVSLIVKLNSYINTQTSSVEESSAAVMEMIRSIENIVQTVNTKKEHFKILYDMTKSGKDDVFDTDRKVQKLSQSINEVMSIIQVIDGISAQTNLLAMNAAIEAAHAGDAGRGFSVVADEIRKLAEQTSENSKNINTTLKSNVSLIQELDESSKRIRDYYTETEVSTGDTMQSFEEIDNSMQELAIGAKEINTAIAMLQEVTTNVYSESKLMKQGTEVIEDASKLVKTVIEEVFIRIKNIIDDNNEINISMNDLGKVISAISGKIESIEHQVEEFKV